MVEIGRLSETELRDAWAHEAHDFTPWLAHNLDVLGEVLGLPLELEGTEVAVENFAADILARNAIDDSRVLIENQLEKTNHSHLGQILTYLAGLEAQTIVWIAPQFQDAHLSAITWLNEHTADPFAFFAVRLRVVRIGESPMAPVFEVLARPNNWDRQVQAAQRNSTDLSDIGKFRRAFWESYLEKHPSDAALGVSETAASSVWLEVEAPNAINVAIWIAKTRVGVFVRGPRGSDGSDLAPRLKLVAAQLEEKLGANFGHANGAYFFSLEQQFDMEDPKERTAAMDWLHQMAHLYLRELKAVLA